MNNIVLGHIYTKRPENAQNRHCYGLYNNILSFEIVFGRQQVSELLGNKTKWQKIFD